VKWGTIGKLARLNEAIIFPYKENIYCISLSEICVLVPSVTLLKKALKNLQCLCIGPRVSLSHSLSVTNELQNCNMHISGIKVYSILYVGMTWQVKGLKKANYELPKLP